MVKILEFTYFCSLMLIVLSKDLLHIDTPDHPIFLPQFLMLQFGKKTISLQIVDELSFGTLPLWSFVLGSETR